MIYDQVNNKWQNEWLKMNTKLNKIKRTAEKEQQKNGIAQCLSKEKTKLH